MSSEQYAIKDLEKLSGIKAHTIRIWEKRFGIFTLNEPIVTYVVTAMKTWGIYLILAS